MARVTPGPVISSISGSLGAATFRNDASGLVVYNRPLTTNRATPAQLNHRAIMGASAAGWTRLDADIQQAWNTLARQEQIPSFFSRGRKWTGRQLFTCFFTYAEHQYTPLPARWLPTPPVFFISDHVFVDVFVAYFVPPSTWVNYTNLQSRIPTSLNPAPPVGTSNDNVASFWLGYIRRGAQTPPRTFVKVAPLPPTFGQWSVSGNLVNSGSQYLNWISGLQETIGNPPGLPPGTETGIDPPFDTCLFRAALTNERLYYSNYLYGRPYFFYGTYHAFPNLVSNPASPGAPSVYRPAYPGNIPQ